MELPRIRRGTEELALAGILGSAVYNATATLGVTALVRPLHGAWVAWRAWLAALLPPAIVATSIRFGRIGRIGGAVLVAVYIVFLTSTFA